MNRHLNDDELIGRLYGIDGPAHDCAECRRRLSALERRRAEIAAPNQPAVDFLAAQRRSIYSRLGQPSRPRMSWAPAALATLCLAAGLWTYGVFHAEVDRDQPPPAARTAPYVTVHSDDSADAELFSDIYAIEQSAEPRAAAPIRALLEEN